MSSAKSMIKAAFHAVLGGNDQNVPRGTVDARLSEILEHAWIDNCDDRLYYATGAARRIFNETVGEYVRAYRARTGRFPVGQHDVLGNGRRMIYFAPRKVGSGRSPLNPLRVIASSST